MKPHPGGLVVTDVPFTSPNRPKVDGPAENAPDRCPSCGDRWRTSEPVQSSLPNRAFRGRVWTCARGHRFEAAS